MPRKQIELKVIVDLDPMPGTFSDEESARYHIQRILNTTIPHYNPAVLNSLDLAKEAAAMEDYAKHTTPGNTWIEDELS